MNQNNTEIISKLLKAKKDAERVYRQNGSNDFDAGVVEGLKRAIEVAESFASV